MEESFLKLTSLVYKILEFFPESDPLKNKAKERALVVLEKLTTYSATEGWASFQKEKLKGDLTEDIQVLLGYLWIAKSQSWLNSVNYMIVSNEYEKIKNSLKPHLELTQKLPISEAPRTLSQPVREQIESNNLSEISERQKKIIDFLEKNQKAQVMDLQTVLPDVTKRTIRRDLDELLEGGKITRMGEFNQVFYKIK